MNNQKLYYMKPTFNEFLIQLENKFGKLTPQAMHCAEDIYEYYEQIVEAFNSNKMSVITSPQVLSRKIPNLSKYQNVAGFSILLAIIGFIVIFFNWKIAVGILVFSFLLKIIARYMKNKIAIDFSSNIVNKFLINENEGIFDIAQFYIAGIIQLKSNVGYAHLPSLPSNSLTGNNSFARIK